MVFGSYLYIRTHIDEESCWIASKNTQKPLWQEEKTCPLGNNCNKILLHLNCYYHHHPMRKSHPWCQIYSNGVDNDDINQCAYAINQRNNVNPPTKKLKRRWRKNVGLLSQTMKSYISHNGHKNIPNNIMGCSPLPTMGIS
jgi:hypothetical protein